MPIPHPPNSARGVANGGRTSLSLSEARPKSQERKPIPISPRLYNPSDYPSSGQYQAAIAEKNDFQRRREDEMERLRESMQQLKETRRAEVKQSKDSDDGFLLSFVKTAISEEREIRKIQRADRQDMAERIQSSRPSTRDRSSTVARTLRLPSMGTVLMSESTPQRTAPAGEDLPSPRAGAAEGDQQDLLPTAAESITPPLTSRKPQNAAPPVNQQTTKPNSNHVNLTYLERVKLRREERIAEKQANRQAFEEEREYLKQIRENDEGAKRFHVENCRGFVDKIKEQSADARGEDFQNKKDTVKQYRELLNEKEDFRRQQRRENEQRNAEVAKEVSAQIKVMAMRVEDCKAQKYDESEALRESWEKDLQEAQNRKVGRANTTRERVAERKATEKKERERHNRMIARRKREAVQFIEEEKRRSREEVAREREEFRAERRAMYEEAVRSRSKSPRGPSAGAVGLSSSSEAFGALDTSNEASPRRNVNFQ